MLDNAERPGIDETFISACNTSDMRVEAEKRNTADVIIAAGMSAGRLGVALMRLQSEFDAAGRKSGNLTETEFRLLMGRLKSLSAVLEAVGHQAALWQMDRPAALAQAVVAFWLDKNCPACHGRKFQSAPGSPALTAKACPKCKATGQAALPGGEAGKRLERLMDESVERARASIKKRLHSFTERG